MKNSKNKRSTNTILLSKELKIHATINTQTRREKTLQETVKSKPLVVPNMSLSINEILQRYSRGQSLPKTREPLYSEEDYSQLSRMDRLEKLDLLDQTTNQINLTKQQLQNKAQNPPTGEKTTTDVPAAQPPNEPK